VLHLSISNLSSGVGGLGGRAETRVSESVHGGRGNCGGLSGVWLCLRLAWSRQIDFDDSGLWSGGFWKSAGANEGGAPCAYQNTTSRTRRLHNASHAAMRFQDFPGYVQLLPFLVPPVIVASHGTVTSPAAGPPSTRVRASHCKTSRRGAEG
jgi:hypothetical protein